MALVKSLRLAVAVVTMLAGVIGGGCASQAHFPSLSPNLSLAGSLYRPESGGRLPAVVLLAPCAGVSPHMTIWADWLKAQGYVVLLVDSFSPRGSHNACRGESPRVTEVARDALDALNYLKTLPFVDGERVAVMGWSHGGAAALDAIGYPNLAQSTPGGRPVFKAAVAFYPPCSFLDQKTETPTLLLLAGRDDWAPSGQCVAAAEQAGPRRVSWQFYPDAYHAFDQPGPMRTYLGHVLAYDSNATDAARRNVQMFLAERLQDKR